MAFTTGAGDAAVISDALNGTASDFQSVGGKDVGDPDIGARIVAFSRFPFGVPTIGDSADVDLVVVWAPTLALYYHVSHAFDRHTDL